MSKHCDSCTNISTSICKACTYISTAKGDTTPTEYCGYDPSLSETIRIEDLAAVISHRVDQRVPIQLRYVIQYNKLLEEQYGKKENISTS